MTRNAEDRFVDRVRDGKVPGVTIDPYNPAMAYDAMDLNTPPGTRVRFTGHGGYDRDQAYARQHLEVGAYYTVAAIEVGSWSSHVSFTEVVGRSFNTVMFERALPGKRK